MAFLEVDKQKFLEWARVHVDDYQLFSEHAQKAFQGWDIRDGNSVFDKLDDILIVGREAIKIVERYAQGVDNLSNKDKLDAAVDVIDDWIKLPRLFEWADNIAIRYALSSVINEKNKLIGKDWLSNG